jgi:hypothetical protein
VTSCLALTHLAAAPPEPAEAWRGTPVEYVIDTLLLHLDDPSPSIQTAVYGALASWAVLAPAYATKAARAAAGKHRSPALCEKLLAHLETSASGHAALPPE